MIVDIVAVSDPTLRKVSKPVKKFDKKLIQLIQNLKDTLIAQKDPEGVGLAGPQIGKNLQIFAMKPTKKDVTKIVINPKIVSINKAKVKKTNSNLLEGCLSLPNYYAPIRQVSSVTIRYLSPTIKKDEIKIEKKTEKFKGFPAQVVLHEIDHLKGIIFIDKVIKDNKPIYKIHSDGSWEEVELI